MRCVQALRDLDLEPSEQTRALAFKRNPKLNIPIPLTSFIGRERERKEVADLFSKTRLVTLTGSGGIGKTRLAIQVIAEVLDLFPDGVWFLDLAPLSDPTLVPNTLANMLGLYQSAELPITDILINYFRSRMSLVIFDNCEHLISACALLMNSLLTSCEHLSILATSRELLRISGEIPYRVPSLTIPNLDIETVVDTLMKTESVRLFTERAAAASPGFAIGLHNVFSIAQICQRLDGIPLGIELAAARINVLTVEQILKRLDNRFNLLTSGLRSALPRHQTLRATLEWSFELLSEKQQVLFRRLAVFTGGWTLEAAENICAGNGVVSDEVLEILSELVNKSLVVVDESQNRSRYRMLETLRQYANEKLVASGESDQLRAKHLEYFFNLAETAEPHLIGPEQLEWLPLLDADYENMRLAFEWSLSKDTAEPSLNLCRALGWFWEIRCYWLEGSNWVKRALAMPPQNESKNEKIARARALYTQAQLEWRLGTNSEKLLAPAEASLVLALEASDRRDIAIAKFLLAAALLGRREDGDPGRSLLEQSFTEFQEINEVFWQARAFQLLGYFLAKPAESTYEDLLLRSLELARKAGERLTLADALAEYAEWLFRANQVYEAKRYVEESERLYKEMGSENINMNPFLLAEIAWSNGDIRKARSLYMDLEQRFSLLGAKGLRSGCVGKLGLLEMEEGDLDHARAYLEEALMLQREVGSKAGIALYLIELGNLFYLQGKIQDFKRSYNEGLAFQNYFREYHKTSILMAMLGSLYFQKAENSSQLLGVIERHEEEFDLPRTPVEKRYCRRAEVHARERLSDAVFESLFAEGQNMSLDEGLDLALKTVAEM
jgi:predicted ATPase